MIVEYSHKPNLVPPFSFFVYVYYIIWKLLDKCKRTMNQNDVSPTEYNQNKVSSRKHNLISNWTNELKVYG